jgi:FkbH-like protein
LAANGKSKKAIIFDCDNTLWKGILGEDGFENIDMSVKSKSGIVFHEIQSLALALNKQGIIVCLCSKNNLTDINEVIRDHPDMLLRDEYITIKKINWIDKATNIRQIAEELNIGLDSIVFVDDSQFEINLVKNQLPDVKVLQVPEKLHDYPQMLRSNLGLFYNLNLTQEDLIKSQIYKQQNEREEFKSSFSDVENYLISLELKIKIFVDDFSLIPRMAQMTQKTNQFNLTTKRYTEIDIEKFVNSNNSKVFAWSVSDKFGDNGITGLCIVILNAKEAVVDTFLMSCRIIGRNIEHFIMDFLIDNLKKEKINTITAKYIKTARNAQVADFYKKCSFDYFFETNIDTTFILEIKKYKSKNINYIKLENGNKN